MLALARPTFDVPYAEETVAGAFAALDALDVEGTGPRDLVFDVPATRAAVAGLAGEQLDLALVLQVTFTDASMTEAIGAALESPVALRAFPEKRTGGRLRLNSFCGINPGAHALAKTGRPYGWLYRAPPRGRC